MRRTELGSSAHRSPWLRANGITTRSPLTFAPRPTSLRPISFLRTKKARGLSRAIRRSQEPCRFMKGSSVLPSALVGGVFLDCLFFSAAERPFFDNIFVWVGSHRSLNYNKASEISSITFYERTRRKESSSSGKRLLGNT